MKRPTYIIYQDMLKSIYKKYSECCSVYYPVKCNNNRKILSLLNSYGSNFEVETRKHLCDLIDLNVDPNRILFFSPFSQIQEIYRAIEVGVSFFVVESVSTLQTLEKTGIQYDFIVRLQENVVSDNPKMIGATKKELFEIINFASNGTFKGISFYLNSEINDVNNRKRMIDYSTDICKDLRLGDDLIINIGGGIRFDECQSIIEYIRSIGNYSIIVEPGKGLVNPCIDLIATIIALDNQSSIAFLNVGIYNGLADIYFKKRKFEVLATKADSNSRKYVLSGPTADYADIIGSYYLPELQIGDKLIIKECGAYTDVLSSSFYGYESRANYIVR